ncbi:MAG TPA: cyclic nucleotide-binding domain-containing protein [Bdellovibrionales bacterium]|nr:cyclic nucleotide-binding domain-containing protein [Bdellovibrionales bacterium]
MSDLSGKVDIVEFKAGEVLFNENEESFHFYIIQDGQVEVTKLDEKGEPLSLGIVGAGTALGEFAMITRKPRTATAKALSRVTAACVSEQAYQELLGELPEWAVSVMRALIERLRQANEIVRRAGSANPSIMHKLDLAEFDPSAGTITDTSPFLSQD